MCFFSFAGGLAFKPQEITHAQQSLLHSLRLTGEIQRERERQRNEKKRFWCVFHFQSRTFHFLALFNIQPSVRLHAEYTLNLSTKGNAQSFLFKNPNHNFTERNLYKYVTQKFLHDNLTRLWLYAAQVVFLL